MNVRVVQCLIAVALFASSARAEEETEFTTEEVLKSISVFAKDPLSEDGQAMPGIFARYANESKTIVVNIDLGIFHWLVEKPEVKHKRTLLFAVIAGNLQSQLKPGADKDLKRATMLFVFEIYNKIKEQDKEFSVPMIEEQIQAHKDGKLREYIEEHQSQPKPPERA